MRVGSLVFATDQGLGNLAKDFYDNGVVTDVVIVEHGSRKSHYEWYPPNTIRASHPILSEEVKSFVTSMDAMLFFETPFDWDIIPFCKQVNTLSVLMPMYECMPATLPYQPDRFICPSSLDHDIYDGYSIPVPVNVLWKRRFKAEVFVHNSGNLGLRGRNGTPELIAALSTVRSPIKLILRSQVPTSYGPTSKTFNVGKVTVDYRVGTVTREELYEEGDVFIFPEKFNGLSLPLQEAYASGMLVMATDRYPMNQWLPTEPLIPAFHQNTTRVAPRCRVIEEAMVRPMDIAYQIDRWWGKDIETFSLSGLKWNMANSWDALKPRYLEALTP